MNRREMLRWTGAASVVAVAGCVSGDDDDGSPGSESDDTPDATDTPTSESTDTPDTESGSTDTPDENSTDDGADEQSGERLVDVVETFFTAFGEGDVETANSYLHPEGEVGSVSEDEIGENEDDLSVERSLVVERGDEKAVVEILLRRAEAAVDGAVTPLRIDLRTVDGEWRIWTWTPRIQEIAPRARFETTTTEGTLEITHVSGDAIPADELYIRGDGLGATGSWADLGGTASGDNSVMAGDTVSVEIGDEYSITVLWNDGDVAVTFFGASGASESATPEGNGCSDEELPTTEAPEEVDDWLADARAYEGLVDWTGKDAVTVTVGSCENGLSFYPAAIQVDPGTTVEWEWTGEGGAHNIVAESGDFESEILAEDGSTFEHTFEDSGTWLYYCAPHRALGMKGAVVVAEAE